MQLPQVIDAETIRIYYAHHRQITCLHIWTFEDMNLVYGELLWDSGEVRNMYICLNIQTFDWKAFVWCGHTPNPFPLMIILDGGCFVSSEWFKGVWISERCLNTWISEIWQLDKAMGRLVCWSHDHFSSFIPYHQTIKPAFEDIGCALSYGLGGFEHLNIWGFKHSNNHWKGRGLTGAIVTWPHIISTYPFISYYKTIQPAFQYFGCAV
jgi:hypothetical protein